MTGTAPRVRSAHLVRGVAPAGVGGRSDVTRRMSAILTAMVLIGGVGAGELDAHAFIPLPPLFKTCRQMHLGIHTQGGIYRFRFGVARSKAAAEAQVADGLERPRVLPIVYRYNRKLDRDDDGTACERRAPGGSDAPEIVAPPPRPKRYATCKALRRRFRFGVSRSLAAAERQLADGYRWPEASRPWYRKNRSLDRDHDGTACEVRQS